MQDATRAELLERIMALQAGMHEAVHVGRSSEWLQTELTVGQVKTLIALWRGDGARMSHLSHRLGTTVSTATGIVDRLVERGLVERMADREDRRIVLVRLSEAGTAEVAKLFSVGRAQLAGLLEHVATEDLDCVARAMEILQAAAAEVRGRLGAGAAGGPESE